MEDREVTISGGIAKLMDARMAVLVRSGKLEAKGNLKRWGFSEVRVAAACQNERFIEPVLVPLLSGEQKSASRRRSDMSTL